MDFNFTNDDIDPFGRCIDSSNSLAHEPTSHISPPPGSYIPDSTRPNLLLHSTSNTPPKVFPHSNNNELLSQNCISKTVPNGIDEAEDRCERNEVYQFAIGETDDAAENISVQLKRITEKTKIARERLDSWYDPMTMQRVPNKRSRRVISSEEDDQWEIKRRRGGNIFCMTITMGVLVGIIVSIITILLPNAKSALRNNMSLRNDDQDLVIQQSYSDDNGNMIISYAPYNISLLCDSDGFNVQNQLESCQNVCLTASCCVLSEAMPEFCLFGPTISACLTYQPCESLHPIFGILTDKAIVNLQTGEASDLNDNYYGNVNKQDHVIANACSPQSLNTDKGREVCKNYCKPASCCFESDMESCWEDDEQKYLLCYIYSPCASIYQGFSSDSNIANNENSNESDASLALIGLIVDNSCSKASLQSNADGLRVCRDVCIPAFCCFTKYSESNPSILSCHESQQKLCWTYSSCKVLFLNHETNLQYESSYNDNFFIIKDDIVANEGNSDINNNGGDNYGVNNNTRENLPVDALKTISELISLSCSEISYKDTAPDGGRSQCEKVCFISQCCFYSDSSMNCWNESTMNLCDTFEPCYVLGDMSKSFDLAHKAEIATDSIAQILELACSDNSLMSSDGQDLCEALCEQPNQCCYGEIMQAETDHDICLNFEASPLCPSYAACYNLQQRK